MSKPICKQCGREVAPINDYTPPTCGASECQRDEACDQHHAAVARMAGIETHACPAGAGCKHKRNATIDITSFEPGIYELTETITNPRPHKGRNGWCFKPQINAGTRFLCETRGLSGQDRTWIELSIIGNNHGYGITFHIDGSYEESSGCSEAFARAIVAKLKKSEPRTAREAINDEGDYYEDILDQLVKDGLVTLGQIKDAFDRYYNSNG